MKVLFIDSTHPILEKLFEENSFDCDYIYGKSYSDYSEIVENYDGIIIRSGINLDKKIIDKAKKLKFIGRLGAGLENIDVKYAESKNIKCFNSPEGNRDAVGEHALGMLLSLFNNLRKADNEVREFKWLREENRGIEIKGKTVGIIGYGNMGSAFAKRLQGFGVNVIAYDKYKSNYGNELVKECTMDELFKEADIISIHTPLTDETKFLVNNDWINKFEKDFYLINTARGKIVNTEDLYLALLNGKIKGACLDVLEYEKTSFENIEKSEASETFTDILNLGNVIFSPHIAGWTYESKIKLAKFLGEKILNWLEK